MSASLDLEPPDIRQAPEGLPAILSMIDTLFLNGEAFEEASKALGRPVDPSMLKPGGEIVVTLGAEGCRRLSASGTSDAPGFRVATVDTTGAGDCFAAAYLIRRLEGAEPETAMTFANAAAAFATLDYGAQAATPRRADVDTFLSAAGFGQGENRLSSRSR